MTLKDRSQEFSTSKWARRAPIILAILAAFAVFAIIARVAATSNTTNQIQDERRAACDASKKRNNNAKLIVDHEFPNGRTKIVTYRLIDALAPKDCKSSIKAG